MNIGCDRCLKKHPGTLTKLKGDATGDLYKDISYRDISAYTYHTLRPVDMQRLPLPILDGQYGGLACVGVFTYLTDTIGTLREFIRVVKSGGIMVLTQRGDLFMEREFKSVLEELSSEGLIEEVRISEKHPYLPGNKEFSDHILVHYVTCTVV
jgi:hypothetical protein